MKLRFMLILSLCAAAILMLNACSTTQNPGIETDTAALSPTAVPSSTPPSVKPSDPPITPRPPFLKGEGSIHREMRSGFDSEQERVEWEAEAERVWRTAFESERAFIDIGSEEQPMVVELGWISAEEITPLNRDHDYFVHILSVNGALVEPVFAEPVIGDDLYFMNLEWAHAIDLTGDGQKELVLYYGIAISGRGGGYLSAFAYHNGAFERLPIPRYLHGWEGILIEWLGEKDLRLSCDDPAFELNTRFLALPYEGLRNEGSKNNWVDPVYDVKVTDGRLEVYQYLCLNLHQGVGDLITSLRWDENGNYLVDCRFEPYSEY